LARLILIRHGESIANAEQRFTLGGHEGLSERGHEQARATAEVLARRFAPVAVYTSPYRRAMETAAAIATPFDLVPQVREPLREQDFGELAGQPYAKFYPMLAGLEPGQVWRHRAPGGESLLDVAARAGALLDELASLHLGKEIVVVSHGGVMAAMRGRLCGEETAAPRPTPNAWGYVIEFETRGRARHARIVEL
jgi:broad specificity phosphatase PhoE